MRAGSISEGIQGMGHQKAHALLPAKSTALLREKIGILRLNQVRIIRQSALYMYSAKIQK
jgi:hypothetical protein